MDADCDAFVSHSVADAATASRIVEALESRGVRCWIAPRDVRPGHDFQAEIVEALESVRCLILLLSAKANESDHVHREVLIADNAKTPVYPIRIEDVLPSGAMKYQLANRQWLDYFNDRNRVIDSLVGRIAKRRTVLPPKPGAASPDAPPPLVAPPSQTGGEAVADDGVRRWLPPALDPSYLLFQYKGRVGRRSYLFGLVLALLLPFVLFMSLAAILSPIYGGRSDTLNSTMANALSLVGMGLILFVFLYCFLSLVSKRLHDFGRSAWWSVLLIAAALGAVLTTTYFNMTYNGFNHAFESESPAQMAAVLFSALATAVGLAFLAWLLFWPGQSAANKFGPAPSFSRSWRPFDALAQRASARSEFDVPFVILAAEGRIGAKGLATGLVFLAWLCCAIWFFKVVYNKDFSPWNFEPMFNSTFMSAIGVVGMSCAALFTMIALSCILTKRLHDIGLTAWLQTIVFIGIFVGITINLYEGRTIEALVTVAAWIGLVFAVLFFIPGAKDFNAYGPPPGFRVEALREKG